MHLPLRGLQCRRFNREIIVTIAPPGQITRHSAQAFQRLTQLICYYAAFGAGIEMCGWIQLAATRRNCWQDFFG